MKITLRNKKEFKNRRDYVHYIRYLQDMAGIVTPKQHENWGNDTYEMVCYEFCQLRNQAKDKLGELENKLSNKSKYSIKRGKQT